MPCHLLRSSRRSGRNHQKQVRRLGGVYLDLERPAQDFPDSFDVIYCYGVLYHLRTPAEAIDFIAAHCSGLLLLETCVSFGSELDPHLVNEHPDKPSQAISGVGCRPTRNWVFTEL